MGDVITMPDRPAESGLAPGRADLQPQTVIHLDRAQRFFAKAAELDTSWASLVARAGLSWEAEAVYSSRIVRLRDIARRQLRKAHAAERAPRDAAYYGRTGS